MQQLSYMETLKALFVSAYINKLHLDAKFSETQKNPNTVLSCRQGTIIITRVG